MSKRVRVLVGIVWVLLVLSGYWYYTHWKSLQPTVGRAPGPAAKGSSVAPAPTGSAPTTKEPEGAIAKKTPGPEAGTGPRAGETLEYAVSVSKLNSTIANLKVVVGDQRSVAGKSSWHFQAFAHTENPYRMVFELDDQFDSYSDPEALTSLQYEMHLSERGQKMDSVQRMLPSIKDVAPAGAMAARVLPGTRDPLGMLQYLRSVDWSKTPQVRSPVYDGRKLYDVLAMLQSKSEMVAVPAGKYNTSKIEIHVMDNGTEMKDAHFLLYLTNDLARTPVLMEAVLPIATAQVELTKVR